LFSLNPVSILLSGYHGNTDCICAMFCLASAYALSRDKWGWGGVALGAAINVKLVPLMLIPAFALLIRTRRELLRFAGGLALASLPFLPILLRAAPSFRRNALEYNSSVQDWGLQLVFMKCADLFPQVGKYLSLHYVPLGRYVILGGIVLAGITERLKRRWTSFEVGAVALSLFLILTPGFGIQYAVWPVPLLFAASLRWATLYSLAAGVFVCSVYYAFWTHTRPWFSGFSGVFPSPTLIFGKLAWLVLIGFVAACFFKRALTRSTPSPER
jgi:uncharacterized membrane protein